MDMSLESDANAAKNGVKAIAKTPKVVVLMPALNEALNIPTVISDLWRYNAHLLDEIVVIDNASTDDTAIVARQAGATVLYEPQCGYGKACLTGINYLKQKAPAQQPHIVAFMDADGSDYPEELPLILQALFEQTHDFVVGSRTLIKQQRNTMTLPQQIGNALASYLLKTWYKMPVSDLGPFRAIRWDTLLQLNMCDTDFGWTVEMQAKAALLRLRYREVAVQYRQRRAGKSKISGTVRGTVLAAYKILKTLVKLRFLGTTD